jgi:ribosomal protein L19
LLKELIHLLPEREPGSELNLMINNISAYRRFLSTAMQYPYNTKPLLRRIEEHLRSLDDPGGEAKWALFESSSKQKIPLGSLVRVSYSPTLYKAPETSSAERENSAKSSVRAQKNGKKAESGGKSFQRLTTIFSGALTAVNRSHSSPTITVRGIIDNIGIEQVFPVRSPLVTSIEVIKAASEEALLKNIKVVRTRTKTSISDSLRKQPRIIKALLQEMPPPPRRGAVSQN